MRSPSPAVVSDDLAAAALACPALVRARRLTEWVGAGQELTSSGVPRPAAAVEACRVLGISLPRARLRSALDVDEFMQAWATAVGAGLVVLGSRRAWAAPDTMAAADPEQVLDTWVQVAAAGLGVPDDPCAGCLVVLHEMHTAGRAVGLTELAGALSAAEHETAPGEPCPECGLVHESADLLGLAGLLGVGAEGPAEDDDQEHVEDTVADLVAFAAATESGGTVALTPLGSMLATAIFEGCAPAPDVDAAGLMSAVGELPSPVAMVMAEPWLNARTPEAAVRELLTFGESASGGERLVALAVAQRLGPGPAAAWREWASRGGFGAYARQWLAEQGEPVTPRPADEAWLIADALAMLLDDFRDLLPPFALATALREQFGGEADELLNVLRDSGHPAASSVAAQLAGWNPALSSGPATGGGRRADADGIGRLKITLRGVSKPPVWRRVLVPVGVTLGELHDVIQLAMGWQDGHLHMFAAGGQEYGPPGLDLDCASETRARLADVLSRPGDRMLYTYDFGDGWEHEILLEDTTPAAAGSPYPACVAGKGACPPEDCGGAWGYASLKEVLADPRHEEHEDMLDWLGLDSGGDFDATEFSLDEVNARLAALHPPA